MSRKNGRKRPPGSTIPNNNSGGIKEEFQVLLSRDIPQGAVFQTWVSEVYQPPANVSPDLYWSLFGGSKPTLQA